jgi:NAD(P)-dependent dehydrogenase (short-subunit alcohol dehydrogenase family)
VNFVSRADAAAEVVAEIQAGGGIAIALQADIGDSQQRKDLVAGTLHAWGRMDVLVNNAGITSPGRKDLLEATEESWDQVFATNLKGPFFLAQEVARTMIGRELPTGIRRGTIVNISSISAFAASANRADYCIAKSGIQMMTWLLADRLAEHGIAVFEVCPGVIASDMTAPVKEKYDKLLAEGLAPMRRWGDPEDVARAVVMLASGALSYSTGERIHVDGGFHMRRL